MHADSMKSILDNYIYLLELWDEACEETKGTDAKARMMGVCSSANEHLWSFIM